MVKFEKLNFINLISFRVLLIIHYIINNCWLLMGRTKYGQFYIFLSRHNNNVKHRTMLGPSMKGLQRTNQNCYNLFKKKKRLLVH